MSDVSDTWQAVDVDCVDCGAPAPKPAYGYQRPRCQPCDRRRTGELLGLAREITMATRHPGRNETDDALGIDHGYPFDGDNNLECDLIEEAIVELAPDPREVADLIWAVVDYQHQPIEDLRNLALGRLFDAGDDA